MVRSSLIVFVFVIMMVLHLHADDTPAQELNHELQHKILLLRNFYRGDRLHYSSTGKALGNPPSGTWTVDGAVVISKIDISHKRLRIRSKRCFLSQGPDGYELLPSERELMIDIDHVAQAITLDSVHALLQHVFLNPQDRAADFVPAYWKPCFGAQITTAQACRLSPRIAPLFKFAPSLQIPEAAADPPEISANPPAMKIGNGVTPPHAVCTPDPEYSEQARRERIQGILVLALIVDKSGRPQNISVVSPLGYGLDEQALNTVKTWKFEPSRKAGEPVSVYAHIEVSFRLYR
jgi:TonB family protein